MRYTTPFLRPLIVMTAVLLFAISSLAQAEAAARSDQSYDVSLQLIVGTHDAPKSEVPAALASIGRQLRSRFGLSNLRVSNTFLGRVANNGNYEYKSVGDISGNPASSSAPGFVEWSFLSLHDQPTAKGRSGVLAEAFRFGARVPVVAAGSKDGAIVNYESIGLNLRKVAFALNEPTIVGTLDLPGASGTAFLVMTATPVDL